MKKLTHEQRSAAMKEAWARKRANESKLAEMPKLVQQKQEIRDKILEIIGVVDYDNQTLADAIMSYFEKGSLEK